MTFHSSRLLAWKPNPRTTQVVRDPSCLLYQSVGHDAQDRTTQAGQEGHLKADRPSSAFVTRPVCSPQPPAPAERGLHFWFLVSAQKLSKWHLGSPGMAGTLSQTGLCSQVVFLVGGTLGNSLAAPEERLLSVGQQEIRDNLQVHHSLQCQCHHAQKHPGMPGEPMNVEHGLQLPWTAQHDVSRARGGTCPAHMSLCHLVLSGYSHGPMPESILAVPERLMG